MTTSASDSNSDNTQDKPAIDSTNQPPALIPLASDTQPPSTIALVSEPVSTQTSPTVSTTPAAATPTPAIAAPPAPAAVTTSASAPAVIAATAPPPPSTASETKAAVAARSTRLLSLDALRGFDMFWIIGADDVVYALPKLVSNDHPKLKYWVEVLNHQMNHSVWAGFRFYDLIFPMFVFIVGVSLVFSLGKTIATRSKFAAVRRVIFRGIVLYLFGLMYYGGLSHSFGALYAAHEHPIPPLPNSAFMRVLTDIRLMGVLQRIAICYTVAGLLFIFFRPKVLVGIAASLLLIYWGLMTFVRAPGQEHVSFDNGKNVANWIDAHYLPGYKWGNEADPPNDFDYDPEGLLSTLPAIAGCMLGIFAGLLLQSPRYGPYTKFGILFLAGAIAIGCGYSWGFQFPIIKKLWTSSFVLLTAGCATVLLSLFYLVLDVWRIRFWARPFVWIGMNPITLYLVWQFVKFDKLADRVMGGPKSELANHVSKEYMALAQSILALFFILVLARFLYKRQIFLRV